MNEKQKRMKEFVDYHINGDGECNGILLKAYADKKQLTAQQRFELAYFYAICYCIPSAIIMLNARNDILAHPEQWAAENKDKIIFQSDRRYVRCRDAFKNLLVEFRAISSNAQSYIKETTIGKKLNLKKAIEITGTWYFFARFSTFLFVETLAEICGYEYGMNAKMDWKNGDTATSGMLNLFCLDKSADYFDKYSKLPPNVSTETLDKMLKKTISEIKRAGGNSNVTEIETSLCAYRKHFKGTRYNGYYLDRQLEELMHYTSTNDIPGTVTELFELRKSLFDKKYLGELSGWNGIRKNCKNHYLQTGKMM